VTLLIYRRLRRIHNYYRRNYIPPATGRRDREDDFTEPTGKHIRFNDDDEIIEELGMDLVNNVEDSNKRFRLNPEIFEDDEISNTPEILTIEDNPLRASPEPESTAFNSVTTTVGNMAQNDTAYRTNLRLQAKNAYKDRLYSEWQQISPLERQDFKFTEVPYKEHIAIKHFTSLKDKVTHGRKSLYDMEEFLSGDPVNPNISRYSIGQLLGNRAQYLELHKTNYITLKKGKQFSNWLELEQNRRSDSRYIDEFIAAHPFVFNNIN
jgi:hypothetical protein